MLTRRFFVYDTLMGITTGSFPERSPPYFVRYAKSIKLMIALDMDPSRPEVIYPPYLEIDYESALTDQITQSLMSRQGYAAFTVEYSQELNGFWDLARGFFITLIVVLVLILLIVAFVYRNADRLDVEASAGKAQFFGKIVAVAADAFSMIFFWYLFGVCAGWFIFYKMQSSVFCMMPVDPELFKQQYDSMLTAVLIGRLLSLFYKIYFE